MYKIICKAFTVTGDTLTQAVEKWNRVKHSFPDRGDVEIRGIESTRTCEMQDELAVKLASQVMAWDILPTSKDGVSRQFLSIIDGFFSEGDNVSVPQLTHKQFSEHFQKEIRVDLPGTEALAKFLSEQIGEDVQAEDIIHVRPVKPNVADELRIAGISLKPAVQRLYEMIEARHDTLLTRRALPELCFVEDRRSIVRTNLLTAPGYAPYCANNHSSTDRTVWNPDKQQFCCSLCGWQSEFPPEFIKAYQEFRTMSQVCRKCGVTVAENRSKYCGGGSDKDNAHVWVQQKY
jgi:hypothetical protein